MPPAVVTSISQLTGLLGEVWVEACDSEHLDDAALWQLWRRLESMHAEVGLILRTTLEAGEAAALLHRLEDDARAELGRVRTA